MCPTSANFNLNSKTIPQMNSTTLIPSGASDSSVFLLSDGTVSSNNKYSEPNKRYKKTYICAKSFFRIHTWRISQELSLNAKCFKIQIRWNLLSVANLIIIVFVAKCNYFIIRQFVWIQIVINFFQTGKIMMNEWIIIIKWFWSISWYFLFSAKFPLLLILFKKMLLYVQLLLMANIDHSTNRCTKPFV